MQPELPLTQTGDLIQRLIEVPQITSSVAIDGLEHSLAREKASPESAAADFVRELTLGLRMTGLRAVVNLNIATAPDWANDLAVGPLFAEASAPGDANALSVLADLLFEGLLPGVRAACGSTGTCPSVTSQTVLQSTAACRGKALDTSLAFVFDRPRTPTDRRDRPTTPGVADLSRAQYCPVWQQLGIADQFELFLRSTSAP